MKKSFGSFLFLLLFLSPIQAQISSFRILKTELYMGAAQSDYSVNDVGENNFFGGEINSELHLFDNIFTQVDVLAGKYSSDDKMLIGGLRFFYRASDYLLGLSYIHYDLETLTSEAFFLNGELYENDILNVGGSLGYEFKEFGENLFIGELFLQVFPYSNLLISSGVSYAEVKIKQTRADIITRIEYIPYSFKSFDPAIYFQYGGNILTKASIGIKIFFGGSDSFIQRSRTQGFYSGRFK